MFSFDGRWLRRSAVGWLVGAVVLVACVGSKADLMEGVIGLWAFNEGEGDVGTDGSGNGNTGTLEKGFKWDDGRFGGAGLGLNVGRMLVPDSETLGATDGLTIMAWALHHPDGGFDSPAVCSKGVAGSDNYSLYFSKLRGQIVFTAQSAGGAVSISTDENVFTLGEWHHLAVAYGVDGAHIYMDGEVVAEADGGAALTPNTDELRFGHGLSPNGPYWWYGRLDEFALYSRALEPAEIGQFFQGGVTGVLDVQPRGKLSVSWAELKDVR